LFQTAVWKIFVLPFEEKSGIALPGAVTDGASEAIKPAPALNRNAAAITPESMLLREMAIVIEIVPRS
jgi:hypothetical protein